MCEEICGEWLRHFCKCEFIQYNLKTPDIQGEIDVIGINLSDHIVYVCEVAIHLVTGLRYKDLSIRCRMMIRSEMSLSASTTT